MSPTSSVPVDFRLSPDDERMPRTPSLERSPPSRAPVSSGFPSRGSRSSTSDASSPDDCIWDSSERSFQRRSRSTRMGHSSRNAYTPDTEYDSHGSDDGNPTHHSSSRRYSDDYSPERQPPSVFSGGRSRGARSTRADSSERSYNMRGSERDRSPDVHSARQRGPQPWSAHSGRSRNAPRSSHAPKSKPQSVPRTAPPKVDPGKEIIIALMGVTGAGKSYFIREVSGLQEVGVGDSLESCTTTITPYIFDYAGSKIILVDTPGFNDTNRSDTDVLKDIVAWTSSTYKEKRLLSGIIYMHRISDVRMEGSALKNLRMFQSLCGDKALHNVLLTTTQWSNVELKKGMARERELRESPNFFKGLLDRGATLERFMGDRGSGLELIHKLMGSTPEALDIQHQVVDEHKELKDTAAGQTISAELIALEKKYKEELQNTKEDLKHAMETKDKEMEEILTKERELAEQRLKKINQETKGLMAQQREEMNRREQEMRKREAEAESRAQRERLERQRELAELRESQRRESERKEREAAQNQANLERRLREAEAATRAQQERAFQQQLDNERQQRQRAEVMREEAREREWELRLKADQERVRADYERARAEDARARRSKGIFGAVADFFDSIS